MDRKDLLEFIKDRPQSLCKMCGKCCRVVTTKFSYEELLQKRKENDEFATEFLSIFEPFASIDEAKKESAEIVENILSRAGNVENITFYKCKYLKNDNKCSIYEKRPLLCKINPFSAWAIVPPQCGFIPWLEEKKEEKIKQIKHQKKILSELENLLELAKNDDMVNQINKRISKTKEIIAFYEKYGAKDW